MKSRYGTPIIILLVAGFIIVSRAPFISSPQVPISTEHCVTALKYYHLFAGTTAGKLLHPFRISDYPPLNYLVAVPFLCLEGPSHRSLNLATAFFLAVLLIAVYKMGMDLKDARAGILACFLNLAWLCFWEVEHFDFSYSFLRECPLELPLAAAVAWFLIFLGKSDYFISVKYSLLAGIAGGLGMLIKQTLPLYLLPGIIYTLWKGRGYTVSRRNFLLSLAAGALICVPFYGLQFYFDPEGFSGYFADQISLNRAREMAFPPPLLSWESWAFYPGILLKLMNPILFPVFIFSLIRFIKKRTFPLLAATLLGSFGLLLLLPGRIIRHLVPLLPLAALVLTTQWADLSSKIVRRITGGLIILISVWTFGAHYEILPRVWPISSLVKYSGSSINDPESRTIRVLLKKIKSRVRGRWVPSLCVVPVLSNFRADTFAFWAYCDHLPLDLEPSRYIQKKIWKKGLTDPDYVVTRTGDLGPDWAIPAEEEIREYISAPDSNFFEEYELIRSYPCGKDEVAKLYGKRSFSPQFRVVAQKESDPPPKTVGVFSDLIALEDFSAQLLPERKLALKYVWKCRKEIGESYKIFVHFRSREKRIFGHDHLPASGKYPTCLWEKGDIIFEEYVLDIPPRVPDGNYQVWIGVWNQITRLPVSEAVGERRRGAVKAGEVTVKTIDGKPRN